MDEQDQGAVAEPMDSTGTAVADEPTTGQVDEQPTGEEQPSGAAGEEPAGEEQPSGQAGEQPTDEEQPDPETAEGENPDGQGSQTTTLAPAPTRPYGVESWRPLVTEMAVDIPAEVLLRWIKHESGGNPCSTGKIVNGASIENGLFQLYSPDDDHFATPAQLHGSFCSGQTCTRDLSLQEARVQVASGIAYVRQCRERARAQLKQAGVTWDETGQDFWSLVKMQHNLPSVPKTYIPKLRPESWSAFKSGVLKEHPEYGNTSIFSNAEDIGSAA